jgi:hypothetical protein
MSPKTAVAQRHREQINVTAVGAPVAAAAAVLLVGITSCVALSSAPGGRAVRVILRDIPSAEQEQ